ncbi:melatonin receptor type 1A-like [Montipora capricornis]|uniref:melatonin receptor type 1A-like n=1 Tax=Montipora capricornis TaxID=246305 RepID=UPI0035F1119D
MTFIFELADIIEVSFFNERRPKTKFCPSSEILSEMPVRESRVMVLESLTCAFLLILSLAGNVIVIVVTFKKPYLNSSTSLFIVVLATIDLLVAVIPGAFFLVSLTTGRIAFSSVGCSISGFFMHFTTLSSISIYGLIAVNRYFCVLKPNHYKNVFSSRRSAVFLASLLLFIAIVIAFPLTVGWASMEFNPLMATCWLQFESLPLGTGFVAFGVLVFVVPSLVIVVFCYCRILKELRQHKNNIFTSHKVRLSVQEINLTKIFLVFVISFVVLWLPTFVVTVIFRVVLHEAIPRQLALAIPFELITNSAINPWIYGVMNPSFLKKLLSIFRRPNAVEDKPREHTLPQHQKFSPKLANIK